MHIKMINNLQETLFETIAHLNLAKAELTEDEQRELIEAYEFLNAL